MGGEIPEKYTKLLDKGSKKWGVKKEELSNLLTSYYNEVNDWSKAWRRLKVEMSAEAGSFLSSATMFYAYLIGDSGMFDWIERMRQKALAMYNDPERREEAISKGYVTIDGTPLDWRDKKFGRDNPQKGLPLEGEEFERDLFAVISESPDFSNVEVGRVIALGDSAENMKDIELFKFYKFRATRRKRSRPDLPLQLNVTSVTKFREIDPGITPGELANKIPYLDVDEHIIFEEYKEKYLNKPRSSLFSSIRGVVQEISTSPVKNRRSFAIVSTDEEDFAEWGLVCRMSVNIPVIFKVNDEVQVFGRIWQSRRSGKFGVDVQGYLVVE